MKASRTTPEQTSRPPRLAGTPERMHKSVKLSLTPEFAARGTWRAGKSASPAQSGRAASGLALPS
eukprot:4399536-Prymnesium_polylepis.1